MFRSGRASRLDFCEFHKKDLLETPPRDQTSFVDEADFWKRFHNIRSQCFRDSYMNLSMKFHARWRMNSHTSHVIIRVWSVNGVEF